MRAIDTAMDRGDLFLAYDLASKAVENYPDSIVFRHRAVLALARMHSPQAHSLYEKWGLAKSHTGDRVLDIDIASLAARLIKDRAFSASGSQKIDLLRQAAERYLTIYQVSGDFYPGTNAASLFLLCGNISEAQQIAAEVLPRNRESGFYASASRAECALILSDLRSAEAELFSLRVIGTPEQRMVARAQLGRTVSALNIDHSILSPLNQQRVVHFVGHMPNLELLAHERAISRSITALLDEIDAGIGFGSLAAGADVIFAEALLARGAELNVVLPFPAEEFTQVSVEGREGGRWLDRFRRCMSAAAHVWTVNCRYENDDLLQFGYASMVSAGLAKLRAQHLRAETLQSAVWDGRTNLLDYGTASSIALWQKTGDPQYVFDITGVRQKEIVRLNYPASSNRDIRFVLFGDVAGFSKLSEKQMRLFASHVMKVLAAACQNFSQHILASNTWGDGLFMVFSTAESAAGAALAMQEAMSATDFDRLGFQQPLFLRLGLHCGPMSRIEDPMTRQITYIGTQVNRAARIEPLTPPGAVYTTEAFAACLALDPASAFEAKYVGNVNSGKGGASVRVLTLIRRSGKTPVWR